MLENCFVVESTTIESVTVAIVFITSVYCLLFVVIVLYLGHI